MKEFKLLVIEDDLGDQKLIKMASEMAHKYITINPFTDGLSAFDYLLSIKEESLLPNLIILDLNLPRISGIDFLQLLKGEERLKVIPVVVLTTSSANSDIDNAYKNGANSYFTKPLEIDELIHKIQIIISYWANSETKKTE